MDTLAGKQIENYRIEAQLGSGELGTVYRALDTNTNQLVAFKLIHHQLAQSVVFQQRFIREAQTITQLKHPAIIPVHSFNKQEELLYIVMELVAGGSLKAHMERYHRQNELINLQEGLLLIAQVAEALGYAHRHGVVHGLMKPENVLVKHATESPEQGLQAVVGDLGLLSLLDRDIFAHIGSFRSIWPYLSPEQVSGRYVDGRSDIYALGVILYEMTTGRLPFAINSTTDAVLMHTRQQPQRPQQIQPQIPHKVEAIILRALEKEPEARFPTAQLMAQALRDAAENLAAIAEAENNATENEEPIILPPAAGTGQLRGFTGPLNRGGTQRYSTSGQLSVVVTPVNTEVTPGEQTGVRVDLLNRGTRTERFQLRVQGLPVEWITLAQDMIELEPGGRQTLTFYIHPPEDSTSRSGLHRYHLLVNSESDSEELAAISGVVTVKPFARFITSMRPRDLVNEGTCYVWIENEGNFETAYTITSQSSQDVVFEHITPKLNIGPGEEAMATIQVAVREKPLVGNPQQFPFQIQVDTASCEPQLLDALIEMRPPWPTWVASVVMLLLMLLGGLGVGAYAFLDVQAWASGQTTVAEITPTATSEDTLEETALASSEVGIAPTAAAPTATDEPTAVPSPTLAPTEAPTTVPTSTPQPLPTAMPTETAVPPTPTPTATATAVPVGDWNGTWQTDCDTQNFFYCGDVILTQNEGETAVSGTFADCQGIITATIEENQLVGTWTYNDDAGDLTFWLGEDGESWSGNWNKIAAWCGVREGETLPESCGVASWHGEWITNCGTGACGILNLTQDGDEVVGSYANGNGVLRGTVVDTVLQGQWLRGTSSGTFKFFLRPGNNRFSGNFDEEHPWCGHDGTSELPDPCLDVSG
ncbi:MAG: protein kinase [Chloroflexota bacterium]